MRKKIVRFFKKLRERIISFFFDEEEMNLVKSYKNLGILAVISFAISVLTIIA